MIVWAIQRLGTWLLHLMVDTSCRESLVHTLAVTSLLYFVTWLWRWWRTNQTLPPGPRGLPLVGYLPYIRRDFHEELTLLSKQHGPIFSLRMGSELIVVLSDHRIIREAFRREEFACRPDNDFMRLLDGYGKILYIPCRLLSIRFLWFTCLTAIQAIRLARTWGFTFPIFHS